MVPADETYNQGDDVTLECNAAMGGPENIFQWFDSSNSLMSTTSTLTLTNVTAANGGAYTCVITNAGGNNTATTSVFISPYFISQPQATGGVNNTMVILTCEAEAFPGPMYQWFRVDGEMLGNAVTGQASAVLEFSPLQFGNEGDYFCNATSNGITIQSDSATLSSKSSWCL